MTPCGSINPARYTQALLGPAGLKVFLVDRLPRGHAGFSQGAAGPYGAVAAGCQGVFLRPDEPAALGRTLAHELAHFLGLPHVRTITPDGVAHDDPFADTEPGEDNLMAQGTRLSAGQAVALRRSPLLQRN